MAVRLQRAVVLHAELMEIDENLARAELSPAHEAAHINRRKELYETINGPAKAIGGRASALAQGKEVATGNSPVAFTSETASIDAEFWMSLSTATNFVRVAETFGGKITTVASLPPTALYALAAPSTTRQHLSLGISQVSRGHT